MKKYMSPITIKCDMEDTSNSWRDGKQAFLQLTACHHQSKLSILNNQPDTVPPLRHIHRYLLKLSDDTYLLLLHDLNIRIRNLKTTALSSQSFGSGFTESGSESSLSGESGYRSGFLMTKNTKNYRVPYSLKKM
jgi:hypothetical protein